MTSYSRIGLSMMILPNLGVLAVAAPSADSTTSGYQAATYPKYVWSCVGSFIALVAVCHFIGLLGIRRRLAPSPSAASSRRDVIYYRRLPAAIMHTFRAIAFRWTISLGDSYTFNIAEVFLTAAYIAILLSWTFVNSTSTAGQKLDPIYWANTAGQIAASQLPLVTALGMKNNVISFLTGISINQLSFFHRMTARVLCVLIWVHATGWVKLGTIAEQLDETWLRCGFLALSALTLLCIISIRPVRSRTYEVFIIVHLLLTLVFLLGAYYHTENNELGYYVWPSIALLVVDRFLRVLRLLVYNFSYFTGRYPTELNAHVDVLSPDFLRITFHRPKHLTWAPGQSAYITMPGVAQFQSHPFTISTIDTCEPLGTKGATDSYPPLSNANAGNVRKLAFLVRVRRGFTARLLRAAQDNRSFNVLFEGPYCSPPSLQGYGSVILIAGGSGVSFTLPLLLHLLQSSRKNKAPCHRVVFAWAIRDASHLEWISDALLPAIQDIPASIVVEIRLFITGAITQNQLLIDRFTEGSNAVIEVSQGRPDVERLVRDEISCATGDISVNVCGTASLAKNVTAALRDPRPIDILKGGPDVTLHVETFGY